MPISSRLRLISILTLLGAGQVFPAEEAGTGEASRLLEKIQSAGPAEDRAVKVRGATIDMGPGVLVIDDGVLVPAAPVNGRTLEAAFTGDAWFRFSTTDAVEHHQLELFTGDTSLLTPVTHAVLVTGDEKVLERLLGGEPATGPRVTEAGKLFKDWVGGPERQGFAADLALVKTSIGDPVYSGYFAVWSRSPDHGEFYYVVDPSEAEAVTLGQFVPIDLSGLDVWQQRRFKNFLRAYNFFGRFADFDVEHPGDWDTWVSTSLQAGPTSPAEPEHYILDLYVNPTIELDARCSARIRLRAGAAGARTISFRLYAGLEVTGVFGPGEEPLDFVRREGAIHLFLAKPLAAGESLEIRVDYRGDLVETLVRNESYALLDTETWYPITGQVGRSTYDVTLRRPKRFAVLASGRLLESGEESGVAWDRRALELPAIGFTFELGRFDIVKDTAGNVELTFGFQGGEAALDKEDRQRVVDTVKKTLPFFEEAFGPYPLDYMNVATVDRGFSQGYLSMVTLAQEAIDGPGEEGSQRRRERIEEQAVLTIAHEISHQWWGNRVGWTGYRDQWLSEALASYSALVYGLGTTESRAAFLVRNALDWRSDLTATTSEGRTVASLGPVTLGARLSSSKSSSAYQAIVYEKGTVVLRMLARLLGEDGFTKMLGELAKAVANSTIDTATFIAALEKMSGQDLRPFADRFVYGTGIPEVYYRYAVEPKEDGEGWIIRGKARQVGSAVESLKVALDKGGRWRVERQAKAATDVPASPLVVPFQVIITPPEEVKAGKRGTIQRARGFGGRLVLQGQETPFQFTVPEKPERFELDQLGEVLALFHDEEWTPKRTLRLLAEETQRSGLVDASEEMLRKALEAPLYSERATAWLSSDAQKESEKRKVEEAEQKTEKFENARIHTLLARFLMDRGELDGAEKEIVAAEGLLEKPDHEAGWWDRHLLRSRLELARGDAEAAYTRLRQARYSWSLGAEGYALLALAASESGHDRMAEQALEKAEARGVDMRALRQARAAASPSRG